MLAIRRPVTAVMLLVSMVVLGGVALLRLPLAFVPEVEEPRLFVHVPFPNATPEQCERLIARQLEEALGSVKGIMNMGASCQANDARNRLEFAWGHRRHSMTMIAVVRIPFSLIVACGVIWALGKTMNTFTLLGLIVGIGMLVDNAVVVMENVYRHQEKGLSRLQAARQSAFMVPDASQLSSADFRCRRVRTVVLGGWEPAVPSYRNGRPRRPGRPWG